MKLMFLIKERLSSLILMCLLVLCVAIWSIYNQDGHINQDGHGYLEQATYFINGEWKKGFVFYPWPFFSILIAFLNKLTGIHLQIIAHILCLSMFGISVLFYLKILKMFSSKKNFI